MCWGGALPHQHSWVPKEPPPPPGTVPSPQRHHPNGTGLCPPPPPGSPLLWDQGVPRPIGGSHHGVDALPRAHVEHGEGGERPGDVAAAGHTPQLRCVTVDGGVVHQLDAAGGEGGQRGVKGSKGRGGFWGSFLPEKPPRDGRGVKEPLRSEPRLWGLWGVGEEGDPLGWRGTLWGGGASRLRHHQHPQPYCPTLEGLQGPP